jgi:hypothetical protein
MAYQSITVKVGTVAGDGSIQPTRSHSDPSTYSGSGDVVIFWNTTNVNKLAVLQRARAEALAEATGNSQLKR